jgi:hypothetical protein
VDLIVGNFPFGKTGPQDKMFPKASLHNYFFMRGVGFISPVASR